MRHPKKYSTKMAKCIHTYIHYRINSIPVLLETAWRLGSDLHAYSGSTDLSCTSAH